MAEGGSDSYRPRTSTSRPMSAVPNKCDCKRNEAQSVAYFCTNHDVVCCAKCAFEKHTRGCDVIELVEADQNVSRQDEESLVQQLDTLKESRQESMKSLEEEKKQMKFKINTVYRQAKLAMAKLEENDLQKGEMKYAEFDKVLKSDISDCVTAKNDLESVKSSQNKTERFIKYKQAKKVLNRERDTGGINVFEYVAVDDVKKVLQQIKLIGETCIPLSFRGSFPTPTAQSDDSHIIAICELPDGRLTVAKKKLIQLDGSYTPIFTTDPQGEVNGLCIMDDLTVGLCLKTRQFKGLFQQVNVPSLAHTSSQISVGFQKMTASTLGYIGLKVVFVDGRLFIQDSQSILKCKKSDETKSTETESTLFSLRLGEEMVDFTAKRDGSRFYIAYEAKDRTKFIVILNSSGERLYTVDDEDLKDMCSFCIDDDGKMFVACRESKRILLFNEKGHKIGLVLALEKQGEPALITLHKKYNRLIVVLKDSDKLLVYDM